MAAHTHVLCMGSGSATGFFPAPRSFTNSNISHYSLLSAFFAKIFFQISVVILNSTQSRTSKKITTMHKLYSMFMLEAWR